MLGRGYPAYYAVADERGLARQIRHAASDASYYARLKRLIADRRALFRAETERRSLQRLIAELISLFGKSPSTREKL